MSVRVCVVGCLSVVRKISVYLGDVLEGEKDKLKESLVVNGRKLLNYCLSYVDLVLSSIIVC